MAILISAIIAFHLLSLVLGACSYAAREFGPPRLQGGAFLVWLASLAATPPLFEPVGLLLGIPIKEATSVGCLVVVLWLFGVYMLGDYAAYRDLGGMRRLLKRT